MNILIKEGLSAYETVNFMSFLCMFVAPALAE
jgi:hypothetical protein